MNTDRLKHYLARLALAVGYEIRRLPPVSVRGERDFYTKCYGREAAEGRRFLNIGAGGFSHPCWTNVDHPTEHYRKSQAEGGVDIRWDATGGEPLPVDSDSVELVYCSHMIEHIPDRFGRHLLAEAHRCLKPGGILRLSTIDVDLDFRAFRANDRHYFNWIDRYSRPSEMERAGIATPLSEASTHQIFLFHFASSASELHVAGVEDPISDRELEQAFDSLTYEAALDYCTERCDEEIQRQYPGNHISWWNERKALSEAGEAGFKTVYRSGWGQSQSPVLRDLRYFDTTRPTTSLYVEAVKAS